VAVHRLNLVGEGLHQGGVHGHPGVKKVGVLDALGLGGEAEEVSGGVQGRAGLLLHLEAPEVFGVEEGLLQPPGGGAVGDPEGAPQGADVLHPHAPLRGEAPEAHPTGQLSGLHGR